MHKKITAIVTTLAIFAGTLAVTALAFGGQQSITVEDGVTVYMNGEKLDMTSEWIFPSPLDLTQPRHPSAVYHRFQKILARANCKRVRFHDLRPHLRHHGIGKRHGHQNVVRHDRTCQRGNHFEYL